MHTLINNWTTYIAGHQLTMKLFHFYRIKDQSGISGTGAVVEGVQFTNGWCALRWISNKSSVCFYQSIEDVKAIHSHQGMTEIVIHDFEALEHQKYPSESENFELFLKIIEEISRIINLSENNYVTSKEVLESINIIKGFLKKLEKSLLCSAKKIA